MYIPYSIISKNKEPLSPFSRSLHDMINIVKEITFITLRLAQEGDRLQVSAFVEGKLYSAYICTEAKPTSRNLEDSDWLAIVESSLAKSSPSIDIKTELSQDRSTMSVKVLESAVGQSVKLLLVKFDMCECLSPGQTIRHLFQNLQTEIDKRESRAGVDCQRSKGMLERISSLEGELRDTREAKESMLTDLMQKMCILLNSKKREIEALKSQLKSCDPIGVLVLSAVDEEDEKPVSKRAKRVLHNIPESKEYIGVNRRAAKVSSCELQQQSQVMTQMLAPLGEEIDGRDIASFLHRSSSCTGHRNEDEDEDKAMVVGANVNKIYTSVETGKRKKASRKKFNCYPSDSDEEEAESTLVMSQNMQTKLSADDSFDILQFTA